MLLKLTVFYHIFRVISAESFPWLLKLTTSPTQSTTFKGSMFLSFVRTTDGSSEEQMFDTVLSPNDQIIRPLTLSRKNLSDTLVKILFASYTCQPNKLSPVIIKSVVLISGTSGQKFTAKDFVARTEHAIGQCVNPAMFKEFTLIDKISVDKSDLCYVDGKFQDEGTVLSLGCRQNCTCSGGALQCNRVCAQQENPNPNTVCRDMNVLGTCCPKAECQHTDSKYKRFVKCQNPKLDDTEDYAVPPWVYFIVTDRYSENKGSWCEATLISDKWLITPAHCVFTVQSSTQQNIVSPEEFIEVYKPSASGSIHLIGEVPSQRISSVKVHPRYEHTWSNGPFSQNDLALLELAVPIRLTDFDQFINLPWITDCYQYFENIQCQVVTTTYANDTTTLTFDNVFGSPIFGQFDVCQKGKNFFCYQKTARPNQLILGGVDGSGVVAKRNGHYEMIGLALSNDRKWHKPGTPGSNEINVLAICDALNWINQTTSI